MDDVPVTRLLLPALLLTGGGIVLTGAAAAPAAATTAAATAAATAAEVRCPGSNRTLDQQTMSADDVFTGTVAERTEQSRTVQYTVTVDRVYKGDLDTPDATVTTRAGARACGLPDLRPGEDYVFFTSGADLETTSTSGTSSASEARLARIEGLLGQGRSTAPVAPAEATFTRVAGARTSFERVAAPGAALVIAGLLGLLLVAGLGRRRA